MIYNGDWSCFLPGLSANFLLCLLYPVNKESRIRVKTSVGISESKETKEIVTQGSIEAGLISSSNLALGVEDFFSSSEDEVSYGPLLLQPQSYQDDLACLCLNPESSQKGLDNSPKQNCYPIIFPNLRY